MRRPIYFVAFLFCLASPAFAQSYTGPGSDWAILRRRVVTFIRTLRAILACCVVSNFLVAQMKTPAVPNPAPSRLGKVSFNRSAPITHYTGLLTSADIEHRKWFSGRHLSLDWKRFEQKEWFNNPRFAGCGEPDPWSIG